MQNRILTRGNVVTAFVYARGKSLVDLTLSGEIDVLVTAFLPKGFYEADYPLVHMLPDYRAAERAYLQRVGYCPAHHLVTVRRTEHDPPSLALANGHLYWRQGSVTSTSELH